MSSPPSADANNNNDAHQGTVPPPPPSLPSTREELLQAFVKKVGNASQFDADTFYWEVDDALSETDNGMFPYKKSVAFDNARKHLSEAYAKNWKAHHMLRLDCYLTKDVTINGKPATVVRGCLLQLVTPPGRLLYFAVHATEALMKPGTNTVWAPLVEQGCWKLYEVPASQDEWNALAAAAVLASMTDHVPAAKRLVDTMDSAQPYNTTTGTGDPAYRLLNFDLVAYRPPVLRGWHVRRKVRWFLKGRSQADAAMRVKASSVWYVLGPSGSGKTDTLVQVLHTLAQDSTEGFVVGLYFLAGALTAEFNDPRNKKTDLTQFVAEKVANMLHTKLQLLGLAESSKWDLSDLHLVLLFDEMTGNSDFGSWLYHSGNQNTDTLHPLSAAIAKELSSKTMKNSTDSQYAGMDSSNLRVTTVGAGIAANALPEPGRRDCFTSLPSGTVLVAIDESTTEQTTAELVFDTFLRHTLRCRGPLHSQNEKYFRKTKEALAAAVLKQKKASLLRQLLTNVRCAAILASLVAERYAARVGGMKSFDDLVQEDALLLAEQTALHFVRLNGWTDLNDQQRLHFAQLVLSLTQTVPEHYTLVPEADMQRLQMGLGAVEDCAEEVEQKHTPKQTGQTAADVRGPTRSIKDAIPWATLCFPDETGWQLNERALNGMRYRVEAAMVIICILIVNDGRSLVPSVLVGSSLKHELFVYCMTHTMLQVHADAANAHFKKNPTQERISLDIFLVLPWLRPDGSSSSSRQTQNSPQFCNITFTSNTTVYPWRSSDHKHPPNPEDEAALIKTKLNEGCIVVEHAADGAAQNDVIVHTLNWTVGLECKRYDKGGHVDAKTLEKRCHAMDYRTMQIAKKNAAATPTKPPSSRADSQGKNPSIPSCVKLSEAESTFLQSIRDRIHVPSTTHEPGKATCTLNLFSTPGTWELTVTRGIMKSSALVERAMRARILSEKVPHDIVFLVGTRNDATLLLPGLAVSFSDGGPQRNRTCRVREAALSQFHTITCLGPKLKGALEDATPTAHQNFYFMETDDGNYKAVRCANQFLGHDTTDGMPALGNRNTFPS